MPPKRKPTQFQDQDQNTLKQPLRKRTRSQTKADPSSSNQPTSIRTPKEDTSSREEKTSPSTSAATTITLTLVRGDLFHDPHPPPRGALLLHACNCTGTWGAGIAKAFRIQYPAAYRAYRSHCLDNAPEPGSALLIPPPSPASSSGGSTGGGGGGEADRGHYIGCLFTSRGKGKTKDSAAAILEATGRAMGELVGRVGEVGEGVTEVRMPRINAGLFEVPWEETRRVVEAVEVPAGDSGGGGEGGGTAVMGRILVVARE
ncbi:hypothetical protein K431DRAFT_287100 [Polychaeton citri CBS 116435]|uniref:ADP-ribose 1''-phosphate phosphatase n=1 Tax=Polychaeton citri CBS 116435 TaxID=1314669 RepID=A0A9P4Q3W2_9PEZI|nr:hypothetical protein K431DRAFT_287100 [Polychaeton citri CBS 116435]